MRTPGFAGANLMNLLNEAAILAGRRGLKVGPASAMTARRAVVLCACREGAVKWREGAVKWREGAVKWREGAEARLSGPAWAATWAAELLVSGSCRFCTAAPPRRRSATRKSTTPLTASSPVWRASPWCGRRYDEAAGPCQPAPSRKHSAPHAAVPWALAPFCSTQRSYSD
jgi:hypothetical protein